MDEKLESLLNKLLKGQEETNKRLDRIETKLDGVVEQTADLTEFRTSTLKSLEDISKDVQDLSGKFDKVEKVTIQNTYDVAYLKSAK